MNDLLHLRGERNILPLHSSELSDPLCNVVVPCGHSLHTVCLSLSWYVPVGHTLHSNPRNALPAGQVAVNITHIYIIDKSRFNPSTFTQNRDRLKYKLNTFIVSIFYLRFQKWSLKKCMAVIKKSETRFFLVS